jgi:basic membrane protein A
MPRLGKTTVQLLAVAMALSLVATACGDDDDTSTDTTADTTDDTSAEGRGTIAYAVAGDRNDGGFYQGQVEAVEAAGEAAGYEVIVVDKVPPGAAQEAFENLARQGPDLVIGGGSELRDGLIPVSQSPEFAAITFIMVAGFPPDGDTYATVGGNENHAHFMGGVASGLLLQRAGADTACIVAGPELDFVMNMERAMRAGLEYVDPSFKMLITYTGDFEDASLAQEAATAQINQGCQVIYPYLGGALSAVVAAGNDAGIDVAATSVDRCGDTSADFALAILYNPALYLSRVIDAFAAGEIVEGEQYALYGVADGVGIGAKICDATPEEQEVLDTAAAQLAAGEFDDVVAGASG